MDSIQDDIIDKLWDLENDVEASNNMDSEIIPSKMISLIGEKK